MRYDFDQVHDRRNGDSLKWNNYGDDVLPLWVADTDFVSPEPVVGALRERVEHGIFGYGSEPTELREVVVERMGALYDWHVTHEDILFIPGVVAGFNAACRAYAAAGDGTLVQTPVYPPLIHVQKNFGLERQGMELTRDPTSGRYFVDMDLFRQTLNARTRLFLLCNPHNPVGRVFTRSELEAMAEVCLQEDIIICSDEIHCDLLLYGHHHVPIASINPEVASRTVTLMAPSKTYNIAGMGCSVVIIQDKELRERFCAAIAGIVSHVNILGFVAALAAYKHGGEWLEQALSYMESNCDFVWDFVAKNLPGVRMTPMEGTFLAWLDCREAGMSANPGRFFLQNAGVALNEGASFGAGGEGFVRLNFGCPRRTLELALNRMKEAMESMEPLPDEVAAARDACSPPALA